MQEQKVKNILFRFKLKGNGIVNYDSPNQSDIHNDKKYVSVFEGNKYNNVNYAKKHFYKGEDNKLDWKIIISSNCLRHHLFIKDAYSQNTNILKNDTILNTYIASPANIMRGYMFAGKITIKKKSAITITDAEQTNNAISHIEQFIASGDKSTENDKKSNTMFSKETIGDITYDGMGVIDLMQLQFVSCCQEFDRFEFKPDNIELYKSILKGHLDKNDINIENNIDEGYFYIKNSSVLLFEFGIKYSNEIINYFVREFFKRMLSLNIRKSSAYAALSYLEYKLVLDPINDTFFSDENWNVISNIKDIENINFETNDFYVKSSEEEVSRTKKSIAEFNKKEKDEMEKKKKEEEKAKKDKKSKSDSENE